MRTLAIALAALCAAAASLHAQGIVVESVRVPPDQPTVRRPLPVRLTSHRVDVTIADQRATTNVVQVFRNPNPWNVEGVYLFPLPENAAVADFTMSMGGKQVTGEILDAKRARDIYTSIVRRRDDPGLLEYAGRRCIRARLFPIPPRGDTKVTLTLHQVLEGDAGLVEYRYPLRSDAFGDTAVQVSGKLVIASDAGVESVFSPSHRLDLVHRRDGSVAASFEEARSRADRDLQVYFGLGRRAFGAHLMSTKPPAEAGTFSLLLAPHRGAEKVEVLPRDVVLVLDTSGSMGDRGGAKLRQAQAAVGYALGRLDPRDSFNVVAFATEALPFRDAPVPATRENVAAAVAYVEGLKAAGGTAIHDALTKALAGSRREGRVPIVIFLTDGQATIGPAETGDILRAVSGANDEQARLFVFGVGNDVNTELLGELARTQRGAADYVAESENIELKVSALVDKLASPVLTDAEVVIDGGGVFDVLPRRVGDLFQGQQVVLVGRYAEPGPRAVRLRGKLGGKTVEHVYEVTFADKPGPEFLPRLWAVRKVGFLLQEIRRNGEKTELVEEVKKLGLRHGIVTPYTSYLVLDEQEALRRRLRGGQGGGGAPSAPARELFDAEMRALDDEARAEADAGDALEEGRVAGSGAVRAAKKAAHYGRADRARDHAGVGVRLVGGRTFRYRDGFWESVDFGGAREIHAVAVKIEFLSKEWLELAENPEIARWLAAGKNVRFLHENVIYEISEK